RKSDNAHRLMFTVIPAQTFSLSRRKPGPIIRSDGSIRSSRGRSDALSQTQFAKHAQFPINVCTSSQGLFCPFFTFFLSSCSSLENRRHPRASGSIHPYTNVILRSRAILFRTATSVRP